MIQPLPIVIVSGFLGAGKTTLMRRLIVDARRRGFKAAVIVNEFGAEDVDSNILRQAGAELMDGIAGGCACCSGRDDLQETLLELGERRAAERPDIVLMEASGLADPLLLLDVTTGADLLPLVRVAAIVSVADAVRLAQPAPDVQPLLRQQILLADWLILNKTDLTPATTALQARLRDLNPHAVITPTVQCEFDCAALWQHIFQPVTPENTQRSSMKAVAHAHAHTVTCPLPHPVERARLEAALQGLPPDVWRAKGFVRLKGEAGLRLVQYTGGYGGSGRYQIAPFHLPFGAAEPATLLVFIGPALNAGTLRHSFLGRDEMLATL